MMGRQADEPLDINYEELSDYLHASHSAYMAIDGRTYYLTDVNDHFWRAQDTATRNEKGHYVDASDVVPTVSEFLGLSFIDGKTIEQVFGQAVFYASLK